MNRLRIIVTIIFEAGGGILIKKMRLKYLIPWTCRIRCFFRMTANSRQLIKREGDEQTISPEVLKDVLEKLGPTFIKLGQVLSLRADLVGEDISNELAKLQSEVQPFSYAEAKDIITKELGESPEKVFKAFSEKPVAAASLAQVHHAYLKDGKEVAVKVQRPGITEIIEQDIHILFYLAHLAERFIPEARPYQPLRIVKEFADWTLQELDFSLEGQNADRFQFAFKKNQHVHIPQIYWDYTTKRVLTMEFLHGVKADDLKGMEKLQINTQELARYGVDALLQQFLIDGFFHADPHPGNFFAMEGDMICLHDFGMVGHLNQAQRTELVSCFVAFTERDTDGFLKHFTHLAVISEQSDVIAFQKEAAVILNEFFYSPKQPSIAWAFFRLINKGARYNVSFPADLALFGKAIITTEAMGLNLYPEFDFNKELKPFVKKALKYYLDPRRAAKSLKTDIFDYLEILKTLPEKTQGLLKRIENGQLSVKFDAAELLEFKKEFDRQNDLRILGIITVAIFLATTLFMYNEGRKTLGNIPLSNIGFVAAATFSAWLFLNIRRKPR